MKEKKNQSQLFGFFQSAGKKKEYPSMDDGSVPLSAGGELSAANRAVSRSIVGRHDNLACSGQCCMKTMFEGGLSPSREQLKGYQDTFLDFIQHGMKVQRLTKMLVGPCNIDLQKNP